MEYGRHHDGREYSVSIPMNEVALYTVANDKIVREEFFYAT